MPIRIPVDTLRAMALEHVYYEVDRLTLWSILRLCPEAFNVDEISVDADADTVANVVGQATLGSALLHLRNTADFLLRPRPTNPKNELRMARCCVIRLFRSSSVA
jgi:hypothetical protein